ncbi:hypothetical protein Mapa_017278 [Marchantia paleacea]|nr:hypothetical protein Mapa_017278 [Marchantia paleacea]
MYRISSVGSASEDFSFKGDKNQFTINYKGEIIAEEGDVPTGSVNCDNQRRGRPSIHSCDSSHPGRDSRSKERSKRSCCKSSNDISSIVSTNSRSGVLNHSREKILMELVDPCHIQ